VFGGASAQGAVSWSAPGVRPGSHLRPNVASINHCFNKSQHHQKTPTVERTCVTIPVLVSHSGSPSTLFLFARTSTNNKTRPTARLWSWAPPFLPRSDHSVRPSRPSFLSRGKFPKPFSCSVRIIGVFSGGLLLFSRVGKILLRFAQKWGARRGAAGAWDERPPAFRLMFALALTPSPCLLRETGTPCFSPS
jgi:hypothetical protein